LAVNSDDAAPATTTSPHPDLLIGLDAIAEFMRVNRKTISRFIREGLPVMRLGLPLATTKRLAVEWIEAKAKETVRG
jgi:hypothetical protein